MYVRLRKRMLDVTVHAGAIPDIERQVALDESVLQFQDDLMKPSCGQRSGIDIG